LPRQYAKNDRLNWELLFAGRIVLCAHRIIEVLNFAFKI